MSDTILAIRLKAHELERLRLLAAEHNRKPSSYVKDLLNKARRPRRQGLANEKTKAMAQSGVH